MMQGLLWLRDTEGFPELYGALRRDLSGGSDPAAKAVFLRKKSEALPFAVSKGEP
jgi:hypothetical protein